MKISFEMIRNHCFVLSWREQEICMLLNKNKSLLTKKPGRLFLILEVIKVYKVKGKNVFHQMAAKNKNVELAEALLKPLVGF